MTYLLIDRVRDSEKALEFWRPILHPAYPRPASTEMAKALRANERRKAERRA